MASIEQSNVFEIVQIGRRGPNNGPRVRARCSKCRRHFDIRDPSARSLPTEPLAKKLRHIDWECDGAGKKALCTKCRQGGSKPNGKDTVPPAAAPKTPTTTAVKATLAAYKLIGEHYLPDDQRYATGFSDAVIGTKTGLAESVVADMRETEFGPLQVDQEATRLQHDLTAFVKNANEEIKTYADMLDEIKRSLNQQVTELRLKVDDYVGNKKHPR